MTCWPLLKARQPSVECTGDLQAVEDTIGRRCSNRHLYAPVPYYGAPFCVVLVVVGGFVSVHSIMGIRSHGDNRGHHERGSKDRQKQLHSCFLVECGHCWTNSLTGRNFVWQCRNDFQ